MCGIAGVWSLDVGLAEASVRAMTAAQTHRGPDDEGFEFLDVPAGILALGQRRLAIVDLSPAGHQPMTNSETGDWIVFNGEIYNYPDLRAELEAQGVVFRSRCDTEVILHAFTRWGTDAFERLHGMFALGLYAAARRELILARDAVGIKPLCYAWGRNAFLFSSELRAIVASGQVERGLDPQALAGLLAYGAVQGPHTMARGVRLLEPGTWASLSLTESGFECRRLRTSRFWDFPVPTGAKEDPEALSALLTTCVSQHLMSDVPLGVFLSSGIDSSAIATLCAEARQGDLDAFTIALADDPTVNEGPVAQETARLLGARYHEIKLTEAEVVNLTRRWLESLDQPSVDGLNTYIISHAVRERGIIVALSGLGGDEVFGGYSTFREVPRIVQYARAARLFPRPVRTRLASLAFRNQTKGQRQKAIELAAAEPTIANAYFRRRRLLSDADMTLLGMPPGSFGLDGNYLTDAADPTRVLCPTDVPASVGILESRFYMGNMLLRDSDVFGMARSLEIRVPLIDRRLIDMVYRIPGRERISTSGPNKPLLVRAVGGRLRPELLKLSKRGFGLSQAQWMLGPLRDVFEDLIRESVESGLVDPAGVRTVWQNFLDEPVGPAWSRAWTLGVLGAWLRAWGRVPAASLS